MKGKIICKTTAKGEQTLFYKIAKREYFLFKQAYRKSVHNFFKNGVTIGGLDFGKTKSHAVRKTIEKMPASLHYLESEYGIAIYEKTKHKQIKKGKSAYKREKFDFRNYIWEDQTKERYAKA